MMCIIGPAEVPVLSTIPNGGNTLQSDDSLDYLLLEEQEAVVAYFVNERGLSWNQMRGRIHGNFFGPFTGIRYIERITRTNRQGLLQPKSYRLTGVFVSTEYRAPRLAPS